MNCLAHSAKLKESLTEKQFVEIQCRLEDTYKVRGKVVVVGVRGGNNWTKGTPSFVNLWWTIRTPCVEPLGRTF